VSDNVKIKVPDPKSELELRRAFQQLIKKLRDLEARVQTLEAR
jgi:hypothetical protein